MPSEDAQSLLDPAILARVSGLVVRARMIVEGSITGLHRSPFHGSSVEFAEHREYVPGDDIRHIDWKVFGHSKTSEFSPSTTNKPTFSLGSVFRTALDDISASSLACRPMNVGSKQ